MLAASRRQTFTFVQTQTLFLSCDDCNVLSQSLSSGTVIGIRISYKRLRPGIHGFEICLFCYILHNVHTGWSGSLLINTSSLGSLGRMKTYEVNTFWALRNVPKNRFSLRIASPFHPFQLIEICLIVPAVRKDVSTIRSQQQIVALTRHDFTP